MSRIVERLAYETGAESSSIRSSEGDFFSTRSLVTQRFEKALWLILQFCQQRWEFGQQLLKVFRLAHSGQAGLPHLQLAQEWGLEHRAAGGGFPLAVGRAMPKLTAVVALGGREGREHLLDLARSEEQMDPRTDCFQLVERD